MNCLSVKSGSPSKKTAAISLVLEAYLNAIVRLWKGSMPSCFKVTAYGRMDVAAESSSQERLSLAE